MFVTVPWPNVPGPKTVRSVSIQITFKWEACIISLTLLLLGSYCLQLLSCWNISLSSHSDFRIARRRIIFTHIYTLISSGIFVCSSPWRRFFLWSSFFVWVKKQSTRFSLRQKEKLGVSQAHHLSDGSVMYPLHSSEEAKHIFLT